MADISTIKIRPGDKFYHWTVNYVHNAQKIDCVCDCGYEKQQRQTDLLRGVTRQCPRCYAKKPKAGIQTGKRFGKWTIVNINEYILLRRRNGNVLERQYKCICDCGVEKYIRTSHLTRGLTKQCNTCRLQSYYVNKVGCIPMNDIQRYKIGAKRRNKEWSIEPRYLFELFDHQQRRCAISGIPIFFSEKGMGYSGSKDTSTASLDRIDSHLGYVVGNVQWVHKDINKIKMDLSEDRFFDLIKRIYEFKQLNIK